MINAWDLRNKMMEDGNLISANPTHLDWEEMSQPGLLAGAAHGRIDATGDVIRVSLAGRISDDTFRQQVKQELAEYIGADVDKVKGYDFTGDGMPEVFDPAAGYDDGENQVIPGGAREAKLKQQPTPEPLTYLSIGHGPGRNGQGEFDSPEAKKAYFDNTYLYFIDKNGNVRISENLSELSQVNGPWAKGNPDSLTHGMVFLNSKFGGIGRNHNGFMEAIGMGRIENRDGKLVMSFTPGAGRSKSGKPILEDGNLAADLQEAIDNLKIEATKHLKLRTPRSASVMTFTRGGELVEEPGAAYDDGEQRVPPIPQKLSIKRAFPTTERKGEPLSKADLFSNQAKALIPKGYKVQLYNENEVNPSFSLTDPSGKRIVSVSLSFRLKQTKDGLQLVLSPAKKKAGFPDRGASVFIEAFIPRDAGDLGTKHDEAMVGLFHEVLERSRQIGATKVYFDTLDHGRLTLGFQDDMSGEATKVDGNPFSAIQVAMGKTGPEDWRHFDENWSEAIFALDPNKAYEPGAGYGENANEPSNHGDAELESRGFLTNYANESDALEDDLRVEMVETSDTVLLGHKTLAMYKGKKQIGTISWSVDEENDATIEWASINKKYQDNGLGKVLYAEAGERMRRRGIKNVYGVVVDSKERPVHIREIVFGNVKRVKFKYPFLNVEGDKIVVSKLKRRLSSGPGNGTMTKEDVIRAAKESFGDDVIQALIDAGVLNIVDDPSETDMLTPLEAEQIRQEQDEGKFGVQGFAEGGRAVLFATQFQNDREVEALILHEVGRHIAKGSDMRNIRQIFDDMVFRSKQGGVEGHIAREAVCRAIWAMVNDPRFKRAVSLLGGNFVKFRGMEFTEMAETITDDQIDTMMDAMLVPAGGVNQGGRTDDKENRQAFAAILMEEVGAYVANARIRFPESDLVQGMWEQILGYVRRMVYKITGGKYYPGRFTTADVEAMDRESVRDLAREPGRASGRRFSVTPEEAQRTIKRPMAENMKPPADVAGITNQLTEAEKQNVERATQSLSAKPGTEGGLQAKPLKSGFQSIEMDAAMKPIDPPGSGTPQSEVSRSEIEVNKIPVVSTAGMQMGGEGEQQSSEGPMIPGSGTGAEQTGFGTIHQFKHIGVITARLAAVTAEADGSDVVEKRTSLRSDPIAAINEARDYVLKNQTHIIPYYDGENLTRIAVIDNNSGMTLILDSRELADGSPCWSVRTFLVASSDEKKDNYTGNMGRFRKIDPAKLLENASRFGKSDNKVPVGWTIGDPVPANEFDFKAKPKSGESTNEDGDKYGRRLSVAPEVGGDTQNPAPTSPPPLPPQPPAPVAPGPAPVNPEVSAWQRAWDIVTLRYFSGISVKAHQNARRFQGASIQAVADLIHNRPGSQGSAAPRSIPASIATARGKFTNRFRDIMAPLRDQLAGMDTAAREAFYESLTDMITGRRNMGTGLEGQVADNLKKLLAEMHAYRLAAGDELGEIQDYFPVVYNSDLITKNRVGFMADAERAYRIELSSTLSGPELDAAAAAAALALYNTHVRGMGAQEFGSLFNRSTPGGRENSSKERAFGRQAQNIMRKWQSNDPFLVITRYIGGAVKSAELARRFGADGMGWESYAKGMEAEGVPQEIIEEMYQLVTQAAGVSTPGLGKAGQGFMDFVALYTAATSLGKSFMSNLFEPIAMGIRTGSPIYALRAYGETWTRSLNEFLKDVPIARMLAQESFWQQYGEHIGTIHNSLEDAWMTTHSMELGMDNQNPRMRWLTNRVYKANLMDATETAKQQASHALGHSYIGDLCKMISGSHWMNAFGMDASRSARQDLIELGVPESEHQAFIAWMDSLKAANPQQRMTMMTDGSPMSKLYEEAQVRFTNQSAVRANRAHRPVFQDNLMGKMFLQLQSFSYSYAAEANSRIYDNLKRSAASGDYTMADRMRLIAPAMMLPMAIAAFAGMFKLRRELYPTEATMKRDNDPWWAQFMDAASYAGMFGPKVEQAMKFVMRDQPPGGIVGQHAINTARAAKGYATAAIGPDEKYDKAMASANKAAVKAAIPPVKGAIVAGASAINPLLGTAASVFANDTTLSNQAIEATQPEPPDKKREIKNPYNYRQPRREPGR